MSGTGQDLRRRGSVRTDPADDHVGDAVRSLPFGMTEKEVEVLRLVNRTRSTGEIARIVGRSIHTVEAQIKSARRRLSGVDRYTAADRLRAAEGHGQTGVNLDPVMSGGRRSIDEACTDNERTPERVGGMSEPPQVLRDFTSIELPGPRNARPDDASTDLTTILKILGIAAIAVLLLLAAPQLGRGAQLLAQRILPN